MEGVVHGNGEVKQVVIKKSEAVMVQAAEETESGDYYLSKLDQNLTVIMKTVQLFEANEKKAGSDKVIKVMKEALEKVLVYYHPLTGSLDFDSSEGKLVVRCDRNGVVFVEAVADCEMEASGDLSKLGNLLVHTIPRAKNILETPLLTVQVTMFKCGGFALGTAINHCMVDGLSHVQFLKAWAETARGVPLTTPPFLDRTILKSRIPPQIQYAHQEFDEIPDQSNLAALYDGQPLLYRSFTFDPDNLSLLKNMATGDGTVSRCSTFVALSAFVWRARTKALDMGPTQKTRLYFAVDARNRLEPPLPAGFWGNGMVFACCICEAGELTEKPLSFGVKLVHEAVERMRDEFMRSGIDYVEVNRKRPSLEATLVISTWTRLDFWGLDFGWGEPVETGPIGLPQKEVALFLPQSKETTAGTVLFIGLPASSMAAFQELVQL